jgi:hypothetical protein
VFALLLRRKRAQPDSEHHSTDCASQRQYPFSVIPALFSVLQIGARAENV